MQESFKQHFRRRLGFRDPVFVVGLFVLYAGALATPAFAYLDPGTGSFIFQLIVSAVVGAAFVIKSYWLRLKSWFTGNRTIDKSNSKKPD